MSLASSSTIAVMDAIAVSTLVFHLYTIQAPYSNCSIITSWCQNVRIFRIPTHTVDSSSVARQCLYQLSWPSMPYIYLQQQIWFTMLRENKISDPKSYKKSLLSWETKRHSMTSNIYQDILYASTNLFVKQWKRFLTSDSEPRHLWDPMWIHVLGKVF